MKRRHLSRITGLGLASLLLGMTIFSPIAYALAAPSTLAPVAKVSFTFDDGLTDALTKAAPVLANYGYAGTSYAISSCVGTVGTCAADTDASYMTWPQITQLQNTYHWEIGSHSVSHPLMTEITTAKLEKEVRDSKQTFATHNITTTAFATPYGDYNPTVQAAVAKYYSSHRGFADQQYDNDWPYNESLLYVKQVQAGVSLAQVKSYIDAAKQNKQWLVLVFHGIADVPSNDPDDYQYATSDLDQIAAYVQAQNLPVVTPSNGGIVSGGTNLLANSTFDAGLANGWTTDAAANVKKDTAAHGSYPSPQNSIALVANTAKAVHLFSPKVAVDATKSYLLKTYLAVPAIQSGEVTYYIDEYDSTGNWISGQYKGGERGSNTLSANLSYKPSSANVKQASYQIAVGKNTGIKAYVDNVQWVIVN